MTPLKLPRKRRKTQLIKEIDLSVSWIISWFARKTLSQSKVKVDSMWLSQSHLSSWIKRKDSRLDKGRSSKWCMRKLRKRIKLSVLNIEQEKYQRMSKKRNLTSLWKEWKKEEQRPNDSLWPKSKQLRLHSNSMKEIWRLKKIRLKLLSFLLMSASFQLSELVRFLGEFLFHSTRAWWMMLKIKEKRESRKMLRWLFLWQNFHQEWRLQKNWEKNDKKEVKDPTLWDRRSASSHQHRRKSQTSNDSTRSLQLNLREIRVAQDWLSPSLSTSMSQRMIHLWESTWTKITNWSIPQRWSREQDRKDWIKI